MTDVRLDGTDSERRSGTIVEHACQRLHFDRISEQRASTVRLDILHRHGRDTCIAQRLPDQRFLTEWVRSCETRAAPVVVDRRSQNGCIDAVAGGAGVGESFQNEQHAAFAGAEAIGRGIERPASPISRDDPQYRLAGRLGQKTHTTGDGDLTLPTLQARDGVMNGYER